MEGIPSEEWWKDVKMGQNEAVVGRLADDLCRHENEHGVTSVFVVDRLGLGSTAPVLRAWVSVGFPALSGTILPLDSRFWGLAQRRKGRVIKLGQHHPM